MPQLVHHSLSLVHPKELKMRNLAKFFSYAGNGKHFKELSTLILNKIVISGGHMSSVSVARHARLADWRNKAIRNEEYRKQWRVFPNTNIDMTIQRQVLSVYALRSQLHMLQCLNKNTHQHGVPQQSTQNTTNCSYRHAKKTSGLF